MTTERIGSKRTGRKTGVVLAAALLGLGVAGLTLGGVVTPAGAQLAEGSRAGERIAGAPFSFADLVEKVKPAVVSVYVTGTTKPGAPGVPGAPGGNVPGLPNLPEDHPLNKFFKKFERDFGGEMPSGQLMRAQGAGFIISPDGYVVTNNHVVKEAERIKISFDGDKQLEADLIGSDERTDIALLKIKQAGTYPAVRFAKKEARVGDWVLAVGNPFGLASTVTAGIISARGRDVGESPYDFLQIDAAVNKGNSGGPTFDLDGNVVGVNTSIISPSGGNVGIAFAVPAEVVEDVVAQLKEHGAVSRGWLGVQIQSVSEDMAASLGLNDAHGAIVGKLTKDSPAAKSGVKVGDLILKVDGAAVKDSRDLARKIAALQPDSTTDLTVFRDGREQKVPVKLGMFPGSEKVAAATTGNSEELESLGLTLAPASEFSKGETEGVVVTDVNAKSIAAEKGLKRGDVILDVNFQPVSSPEQVEDAVRQAREKGRKAVMVRFRSSNNEAFIALPIEKRG